MIMIGQQNEGYHCECNYESNSRNFSKPTWKRKITSEIVKPTWLEKKRRNFFFTLTRADFGTQTSTEILTDMVMDYDGKEVKTKKLVVALMKGKRKSEK